MKNKEFKYKIIHECKSNREYTNEELDATMEKAISLLLDDLILNGHLELPSNDSKIIK